MSAGGAPGIDRGRGTSTFLLAHLSDPHLSTLAGVRFTQLLNKRMLGYLNWIRSRRRSHRPHILEALLRDLSAMRPHHVVVTGDLTHLGLPAEFREAGAWLRRLGPPGKVTVVPGNHDLYVAEPWHETFGEWAPYLGGEGGLVSLTYPILRVRGPAALIGLSSARPSAPFFALGSLGSAQLARFDEILEETGRRGLLRIVLIHHPPVRGSVAWSKRLTDARLFAEVLARRGAELILHGHAHVSMARGLIAGARTIPSLGVPSASHAGSNPLRAARYHLCRFEGSGDGWVLKLTARALSLTEEKFATADEKEIPLPAPTP